MKENKKDVRQVQHIFGIVGQVWQGVGGPPTSPILENPAIWIQSREIIRNK